MFRNNRNNKIEDDDGFRPVYNGRKHYKKQRNGDIIINPSKKEQINEKVNKKKEDDKIVEDEKDIPFTIIGPGRLQRERMVNNINSNLNNSPLINISKLLFVNNQIEEFIKTTDNKTGINLEFWDYIENKTSLLLNVNFIDEDKPRINYAYEENEYNKMFIKQDEFINLITRSIFKQNGLNIINQCITFSNIDFDVSREDKDIKSVGVITYALHNDTPDCKIKYFELMKIVMYNMLNLFVKGFAGKAYMFRINPQGSRICFEYHYDLGDWALLLGISKYFNGIFEHIKCSGWKYDRSNAYMKYEFIRYVKSKK